jgi:hypothetical protein
MCRQTVGDKDRCMPIMFFAIVITVCVTNLLVGICAAGFFGYGPLRDSLIVRFVSDPIIQPPAFLQRLRLPRLRATTAATDPRE